MTTNTHTSVRQYQGCIDACMKCMQACEECLSACLKESDVQARIHCISMLRDCSDICALAAQLMSRGSMHASLLCTVCATICEACAADCSQFPDNHCKQCADLCRACANECRTMAG